MALIGASAPNKGVGFGRVGSESDLIGDPVID